eukprot:12067529-Alexandrium_andersonii.AAC.1
MKLSEDPQVIRIFLRGGYVWHSEKCPRCHGHALYKAYGICLYVVWCAECGEFNGMELPPALPLPDVSRAASASASSSSKKPRLQ